MFKQLFQSHGLRSLFLSLFVLISIRSSSLAQTFTDSLTGTHYRVESSVTANFPVGMVFAPDGRLFYNEKTTGNVRVVLADGTLQREPAIHLDTDALQERGMLGIALDPDFATTQQVYVVHTAAGTARDYPANRLVRFRVTEQNRAEELEELWRLPITNGLLLHNGGNVHFDKDGYLYLSLGDYGDAVNAQDTSTPQGGLHRFQVTETGLEAAEGNPFGDENSLFAYGLRNPFDFTFDPYSNRIFATESGPNCDDEVNLIIAGFNYGWHEGYECVGKDIITGLTGIYAPPMLTFTPPIAPTGILVYDGEAFPEWQGNLFFCDWNTGKLRRVILDEGRTQALEVYEVDLGQNQCRIDLVQGNDGALYFGTVGEQSGAILRLVPR